MFCCVLLFGVGLDLNGGLESDIVTSWLDGIKLGSSYVRTRVVVVSVDFKILALLRDPSLQPYGLYLQALSLRLNSLCCYLFATLDCYLQSTRPISGSC